MSQRERWIVYPLLFFSFALAIRDQWPSPAKEANFHKVNCDVLNCLHLVVRDANGIAAVDMHATPDGNAAGSGRINIYGGLPKAGVLKPPAVRMYVKQQRSTDGDHVDFGVVEAMGPLGSPATQLTSDGSGGKVHTFDLHGKAKATWVTLRSNPNQVSPTDAHAEDPRQVPPRPPIPPDDAEPADADADADA